MLLIAIPKSASTSLMHTLGMVHSLKYTMHFEWEGEKCAGHDSYHQQHNFGWELNQEVVDFISQQNLLFKIHIFPSENNRKLLRAVKKVVLLREPSDIVQAYRRGKETGVYKSRLPAFQNCVTPEDWHDQAVSSGLLSSLEIFYEKWLEETENILHIQFEKLITDPKTEINRIERFWGLPQTQTSELSKRKFSRQLDSSSHPFDIYKKQETKDIENPLFIKGKWTMNDWFNQQI